MESKKKGSGCLSSILSTLVLSALLTGGIWYFFGKVRITSTLDGAPLSGATVELNGVELCRTPCELRLKNGSSDYIVTPPAGVQPNEPNQTLTLYAVSFVTVGGTMNVPFTSRNDERADEAAQDTDAP